MKLSKFSKFLVEAHCRVAKTGNGSEHRGPRSRNEDDVAPSRLCDGIGSSVAIASGWLEGRREEEGGAPSITQRRRRFHA